MIFPASSNLAKGLYPSEEAFDFPATVVASQGASILARSAIGAVWSNQFNALLGKLFIKPVAVVSPIGNQPLRQGRDEHKVEKQLDQGYFVGRGACCAYSDRKTMSVDHCHDFGPFAATGFAHFKAPFFADTNIASIKLSFRSMRPRSCKSWARVLSNCSMTPSRAHCWKRRCTVLGDPYRAGKSSHRAPLRNSQSTPFSTLRWSAQGLPRLSVRTGSSFSTSFTAFHCSSVKSTPLCYPIEPLKERYL
jgi:hypothetical protein